MANPKQYPCIVRYVDADSNSPFDDVSLSNAPGITAPSTFAQNLTTGQSTESQVAPADGIIKGPNSPSWWWEFAFWRVVGGQGGSQTEFWRNDPQNPHPPDSPSVTVQGQPVTANAFYFYSGGPDGPGGEPDSSAALIEVKDWATLQTVDGGFFYVP